MCLKVFDLDRMQSEGTSSSTTSPDCIGILRIFTNQFPEAKETTSAMRNEIQELRTNARIFQLSKCPACTFTLDLPALHFMCIHSFHQCCLGDNEKECPVCAPEYKSVLETKRSLEQNSIDQDRFLQQVQSSKDGFSVTVEYFWEGVDQQNR